MNAVDDLAVLGREDNRNLRIDLDQFGLNVAAAEPPQPDVKHKAA